ncbi:enoyl-CoA hydratase [Bacillus mangrovi]|uniref:Enoyl-CoA hydratase n=1 Tax=Metabacillus mangrovi TaxID=1491830 RepID=A0A7X2S460_9BACI|nr:enoyl-CoA hydratase [Metabacillus mangrovi]
MGYLTIEKEEYVAAVKIDNPPANALGSYVLEELAAFMEDAEHDPSIRVILLYGEGKFFSAGADIKEFTQVESGAEFSKLAANGQQLFEKIESFSKPVIAAIHGAALGGGLELAMSCHIRIVTENAKLGLPELQLGLVPGFGGTQRLPRYVGQAKALEMMATSEPISGSEAARLGLANKAVQDEMLLHEAKQLAGKMASKSPNTLKAALELLQTSKSEAFHKGMEREAALFGEVFDKQDAKEGIQAFLEKRKPQFKGE